MSAEVFNLEDARRPMIEHALKYARAGISVFAGNETGKAPAISNKALGAYLGREIRKGEGGLNGLATTDEEFLRWQFSRRGAGSICMPCGEINGVIVLDLDLSKEGPTGNAHEVQRAFWDEIEESHTVRTRSGNLHVYFDYEPGHMKGELGPNVDVLSNGSYCLLPPSKGYKVERLILREDWMAPPWVATQPIKEQQEREPNGEVPDHVMQAIRRLRNKDGWHEEVRTITAHLVGAGWSDAEILRYSFQWTWPGHNPRETFEEVCVMIDGARAKGWGN